MSTAVPAKYLRVVALIVVCGLLCVVALNYVVDSYELYHPGSRWSLRSHPLLPLRERLYKPYAVLRAHPRTLLLGHSRVQIGLDPQNALLPQPAYNAAYGGGTALEALLTYRFVVAKQPVALAIMALDPHMLFDPDSFRDDFEAARLDPGVTRGPGGIWLHDLGETLLTSRAVYDSLHTVALLRGPSVHYKNGARDQGLLERDHPADQQRSIIRKVVAEAGWNTFHQPNPRQIEAVTNLIRECSAHGTRLVLFVSPLHAAVIDSSLAQGDLLYRQFLAMQAAVDRSGLPAELWTFLDFNAVTMEPFPLVGATRRMVNYWEVTHFTRRVGDMLLERMLSDGGSTPPSLAEFGHRIDIQRADWPRQEAASLLARSAAWRSLTAADPADYLP